MTRFRLYHTVTDTLGRHTGELWTLDEQTHQPTIREPKNANTDVTERIKYLTTKLRLEDIKRSERRKIKNG